MLTNQSSPSESDQLTELLNDVEEFLVENIPVAVKNEKFTDPVYGLILIYTGVDSDITGYPPPLLLPTVKYRDQIESGEPPGDWGWGYMLWSSCEMSGRTGIYDAYCDAPDLRKKLELIFDLTIGTDVGYEPVRNMFQRVVRRLNQVDWSTILNVSDDFIVVASDNHGEFTENLEEYITPEKIRLLKERGRLKC